MRKVVIEQGKGKCPECATEFEVVTPKGRGVHDAYRLIGTVPSDFHKEILYAYMSQPFQEYTTQQIIYRINIRRHLHGKDKKMERHIFARPHSELVALGIINVTGRTSREWKYQVNISAATKILDGGTF